MESSLEKEEPELEMGMKSRDQDNKKYLKS